MTGLMNGLMSTQNPFLKLDANTNADVKCEQYLKMVKNQQMSNSFYRPQRSCGKVMFLHLCVIMFTGGLCPGGSLWGFSVQGVSVQGVSVGGVLCRGEGFSVGGFSVQGVSV